jgi:hypothetical protein
MTEDRSSLFKALSAFQRAASNVHKGQKAEVRSAKGNFSYTYADLASVIEAIREPLADKGLCYSQVLTRDEGGKPCISTILAHESGASIDGVFPLQGDLSNPQTLGGIISYYRRYALLGILGLATDDDDAQHAVSGPASNRPATQSMPPNKAPRLHEVNTGGASQRVATDEAMDWTALYSLTRPMGYGTRPAIEAHIGQSIESMSPNQVFDAIKGRVDSANLAHAMTPRRQVDRFLTEKQLNTIRGTLPRKGMDMKAWDGWQLYTLNTDELIAPEDLSISEASTVIDALFAMPDNKEMQAAIEASGGVMAHGR